MNRHTSALMDFVWQFRLRPLNLVTKGERLRVMIEEMSDDQATLR